MYTLAQSNAAGGPEAIAQQCGLPGNPTHGNLMVVLVAGLNLVDTTVAISDTQDNDYQQVGDYYTNPSFPGLLLTAYICEVDASSPNVVTVEWPTTIGYLALTLYEFVPNQAIVLDDFIGNFMPSSGAGSGNFLTTGNLNLSGVNELVIACWVQADGAGYTATPEDGFTSSQQQSGQNAPFRLGQYTEWSNDQSGVVNPSMTLSATSQKGWIGIGFAMLGQISSGSGSSGSGSPSGSAASSGSIISASGSIGSGSGFSGLAIWSGLTITDNGDGTGLATVSGSLPGSVNYLYYAIYTGQNQIYPWHGLTSFEGDKTVYLGIGPGYYFWQVMNVAPNGTVTFTSVVIQNIANPELSPHSQILDAVVVTSQALNLQGLQSVNRFWIPQWTSSQLADSFQLPILAVSPVLTETYDRSRLNAKDDIGYPVLAMFIDAQKNNNTANIDRNLKWRWLLQSAFRFQTLPSVDSVYISDLEPQQILDVESWLQGYFFSGCIFRFYTRETRGLKS